MVASGSFQRHLHAGGDPAPSATVKEPTVARWHGGTVARWHEVLLPGLRSVAVQTHHLMNLRKPWKELGVLVGIGRRLHHVSGLLYAKKNLMTRLGKKQPHDIDATK